MVHVSQWFPNSFLILAFDFGLGRVISFGYVPVSLGSKKFHMFPLTLYLCLCHENICWLYHESKSSCERWSRATPAMQKATVESGAALATGT